jgi:hypothetical protein
MFAPVAIALAAVAAFTTPFTWAANGVVFAGFAAVLGGGLIRVLAHRPSVERATSSKGGWRRAPYAIAAGAAASWELFNLFSAPRNAHPTFSSILDIIDGTHVGHGAMFLLWLALGWYLVTQ